MTDGSDAQLEHVRDVLFGNERAELAELRQKAAELEALSERVEALEALVLDLEGRAGAVGEVIVPALQATSDTAGALGDRLQPEVEAAVRTSAREDSGVLAEALYPVMGPAIRKMIASLFTFGDGSGDPFGIEQIMLIERTGGVLLAATANDPDRLDDADVVSGMLDAIRLFVQEAFDAPEHDGLQDLRVGELAVLVEWGPAAVLASVVRGVPTDAYRRDSAELLESLHAQYEREFELFNGSVGVFDPVVSELDALRTRAAKSKAQTRRAWVPLLGVVVFVLLVVLMIVWIA